MEMEWNDICSESGEMNDWIHNDKVENSEEAKSDGGNLSLNSTDPIIDRQESNTDGTDTLPEKNLKRHFQDSSSESEESNDEDKAWQRKKYKGDWEFKHSDVTKSTG